MSEKKIDIKTEVKEALRLISYINVAGDAVDLMAVARGHLKNALKELEKDGG